MKKVSRLRDKFYVLNSFNLVKTGGYPRPNMLRRGHPINGPYHIAYYRDRWRYRRLTDVSSKVCVSPSFAPRPTRRFQSSEFCRLQLLKCGFNRALLTRHESNL